MFWSLCVSSSAIFVGFSKHSSQMWRNSSCLISCGRQRTLQVGVTELQETPMSRVCPVRGGRANTLLACGKGRVCSASRGNIDQCCWLPGQASLPVSPLLAISLWAPSLSLVPGRGWRGGPCSGTVLLLSQTIQHTVIFCLASSFKLSPSLRHMGLGEGEWSQYSFAL